MWSHLSPALPWIGYVALLLLTIVGLFVNILGLPGLWLIVLACIGYAWMTDFVYLGWWSMGTIIALGLAAELIEFFAGAAGSAKAGGSKRGMAGAIIGGLVGGIVGTPVFPIIGTIAGSIIGCALGAYLIETSIGKTHTESVSISIGAAKGRTVGLIAKSAFGIAMGMVAAVFALPLHFRTATPARIPDSTATPATLPAATQP